MAQQLMVWIFSGHPGRLPGGVFSAIAHAEPWITRHKLTGVLTAYPLDVGCLDWAVENGCTGMSPDKLAQKSNDPSFVGGFSTAAQEHFHYEDGALVG